MSVALMSPTVRRLASVGVVAVVVLVGVLVYRHGAGQDHQPLSTPAPGPVQVKVNVGTPDLRALKAKAGVSDCSPGPGGGALPAVTLPCLGGGTSVDLASVRGPMLLSFWQAGCAPCRKEMPALEAFEKTHGATVPVLGVDFLDQYPGSALQLMQRTGATYPSVADPAGNLQAYAPFARLVGLPVLFFVDAKGDIAYAHAGGVDSETELTTLVRERLGVDL